MQIEEWKTSFTKHIVMNCKTILSVPVALNDVSMRYFFFVQCMHTMHYASGSRLSICSGWVDFVCAQRVWVCVYVCVVNVPATKTFWQTRAWELNEKVSFVAIWAFSAGTSYQLFWITMTLPVERMTILWNASYIAVTECHLFYYIGSCPLSINIIHHLYKLE